MIFIVSHMLFFYKHFYIDLNSELIQAIISRPIIQVSNHCLLKSTISFQSA